MDEELLIQTDNLSRTFKEVRAVDNLNLSIRRGELFGLVGPDGAGKTTTLRLLAGLLFISSGEARINGFDLKLEPEKIKRRIGYMAQQFSLYGELSVMENLQFFADLNDISGSLRKERTEKLLSFAGLLDFKNRRAAHLSGGMQKKLALACTLIHEPDILLLDEPTTGVDPISRREFWEILTNLHLQGTTIIVSTPYMDEADRCSMVGLMYEGKMIECAEPGKIRNQIKGELIELVTDDWMKARDIAITLKGISEVQTYGETLHIFVDSAEKRIPKIKKAIEKAGITCLSVRKTPARMEQVFISMIHSLEEV